MTAPATKPSAPQTVNLVFLRARMVREPGAAWAAAIDYRARMLKE